MERTLYTSIRFGFVVHLLGLYSTTAPGHDKCPSNRCNVQALWVNLSNPAVVYSGARDRGTADAFNFDKGEA